MTTTDHPQRLLVLGAGRHQVELIRRAEGRGIEVVAVDYYPDAPGKAHATHPELVDALDVDANIAVARRYGVAGVVASGTDMAVGTMAQVAAALGLPCHLTPEGARCATDKVEMKAAFARHGVRHPRHVEVTGPAAGADTGLRYPVVVKPADSQGQRATSRIDDPARLAGAVAAAVAESRTGRALVEEHAPGHEVTATAWVTAGEVRLVAVTDRVTVNPPPAIGICFQHVFPSGWAASRLDAVRREVAGVAAAYGMSEGPLYVQMIVGEGEDEGEVSVIEAGARVGGGHEASLVPLVTGVDLIDPVIDLALSGRARPAPYRYGESPVGRHGLVNFLLARPGVFDRLSGLPEVVDEGLAVEGSYYVGRGHLQQPITNSLGRVGYLLVDGADRDDLMHRTRRAYGRLSVTDATGSELLFWPDDPLLN